MPSQSYTCFDLSIENKIAHIQLSRGEAMNTMTKAFWNELPALIREIDRDAAARVIVISSTGKHFSAGMDLSVFAEAGTIQADTPDPYVMAEAFRSNIRHVQHTFSALEEARMPVLIACQGGVIGGAMGLVSAGDIRWCTRDAFFCLQETNIGLVHDVGGFPRLQYLMPEGWVKQMAYTGERMPAAKAKEIGLVNDVFDTQQEMLAHVMTLAADIASKDPVVVTGCKTVINYGRTHSVSDTLDYVGLWNSGMLPAEHMKEGFIAKAEKRAPVHPDLAKLRDTAF